MSSSGTDHACARHRRRDEFTLPGAEKHYPPDLELEPVHLDIDLRIDLVAEACQGVVTTTVEARRDGPTDLKLDAVALDEVRVYDADGKALAWQYDGQALQVSYEDPVALGDRRRLSVAYRVERPAGGLYFSKPDENRPAAPRWAATDHETERARHWLPCVDLPNARPRIDWHLTADGRFAILANGELVEETANGDGTKTAHWRLDFPCPSYLACFVIGELVRCDDGDFEGRPVAYFATAPLSADDLQRSFGRTKQMLTWMSAKLDMSFPFPKYFQFALGGFGGAMENISLVSWDDVFVMDETLATEWTRLVDEINVHEMAHSYFGDAIVCRDFAHAWLKESWATFMEQAWFADSAGRDEQLYQFYRDAQSYFAEADRRYKRPLVTREFASSWEMYDAHLYPGGACRLHTLREEIGDGPFWSGVRDYVKRYSGQVVETDDFRRVLEAHSGRSLGKFFDQWFHTAAYPSIKVSFRYDPKRKEGTFEVEQTQVNDKEGVPAFELSTDVGWVIDGETHTAPLKLKAAKQAINVPMSKEPEQVRFDPLARILHKLEFQPGEEKLRAQLAHAPDVIGRILAGRELAKTGRDKNIAAVRDAYRAESFWGVRAQLAQALGESGAEAAIEALVDLLGTENDPLVLPALLRAAGQYRDRRVATAVGERLDRGLAYNAASAALEALGRQRDDAPLDRLRAAAEQESWAGITQSAAYRALAATRRREVLAYIEDRVGDGACSDRVRPAAVAALGEIARHQDRPDRTRAGERLADLLRDPVRRVRYAAVGGIQTLGSSEAIGALERYRSALPVQEQVRVDRAIRAIRRGNEPKLTELEKQLEEQRAKTRKLGERVEKLEGRLAADRETAAAAKGSEGRGGAADGAAKRRRKRKDRGKDA